MPLLILLQALVRVWYNGKNVCDIGSRYQEKWGRGIQKICEACRKHGSPEPEYTVLGGDITVKFIALQTAKVLNRQDDGLNVGLDVGLENKIISLVVQNPAITMTEMAEELKVTKRTIERVIRRLREEGQLIRKGGKRYGYWEIHE